MRDGASAQYGADAIAGVINLRLREARSGGGVSYNYGIYNTTVETARGTRDANDGLTHSVSGWAGLPLGADGFLYGTTEVDGAVHDVVVRLDERRTVEKGATVHVTTDPARVHVFETATGERLSG